MKLTRQAVRLSAGFGSSAIAHSIPQQCKISPPSKKALASASPHLQRHDEGRCAISAL